MTKLLNLDDLPTELIERSIVLNGKKHDMQPLEVGAFVDMRRLGAELEKSEDAGKGIDATILVIRSVFPTITEDELRKITFAKLNAIMDFLNKRGEEIVAAATTDEDAAKNG